MITDSEENGVVFYDDVTKVHVLPERESSGSEDGIGFGSLSLRISPSFSVSLFFFFFFGGFIGFCSHQPVRKDWSAGRLAWQMLMRD
jgi:hypothetical protein